MMMAYYLQRELITVGDIVSARQSRFWIIHSPVFDEFPPVCFPWMKSVSWSLRIVVSSATVRHMNAYF